MVRGVELTMTKEDVELISSTLHILVVLGSLPPHIDRRHARVGEDMSADDLADLALGQQFLDRQNDLTGAGLSSNNGLDTGLLGQSGKFLRLLNARAEWPLDKEIFAMLDGWFGELKVLLHLDRNDDQVDVGVFGQVFGAAIGCGGRGELVEFDGLAG